jgi:hypothetical protein
MTTSSKYTNPA